MLKKSGQLRIIGGKWRGRKLKFSHNQRLRPTTDFVRETLFNWLSPHIANSICLDLFAGSGALGFEALSRGAKKVVMVEQSAKNIALLQQNSQLLAATDLEILQLTFKPGLSNPFKDKFDIVFLDPPFHHNLIEPTIHWLAEQRCLANNAWIYAEEESKAPEIKLPVNWQLHRNKIAGQVKYSLLHYKID